MDKALSSLQIHILVALLHHIIDKINWNELLKRDNFSILGCKITWSLRAIMTQGYDKTAHNEIASVFQLNFTDILITWNKRYLFWASPSAISSNSQVISLKQLQYFCSHLQFLCKKQAEITFSYICNFPFRKVYANRSKWMSFYEPLFIYQSYLCLLWHKCYYVW